jgi:hypothetical protein
MIPREHFDTIMVFIDNALADELGPVWERQALIMARASLDRAFHAERKTAATEDATDRRLADEAIARHIGAGLANIGPMTRPTTGDLWPTSTYALAQWHLTRVQLLRAAPVAVAAAILREEAMTALDTNPKEAS